MRPKSEKVAGNLLSTHIGVKATIRIGTWSSNERRCGRRDVPQWPGTWHPQAASPSAVPTGLMVGGGDVDIGMARTPPTYFRL